MKVFPAHRPPRSRWPPQLTPPTPFHSSQPAAPDGLADNLLVRGDNLPVLRALRRSLRGQVQCIYLDPPYNTQSPFAHFADDQDHGVWLRQLRVRLELLWDLLTPAGTLWISIDDHELHYLKVLADRLFGRASFLATLVVSMNPKGRQLDRFFAGAHEYLLCFARDRSACSLVTASPAEVNLADFPWEDGGGRFRYLPLRNTNKRFNPRTRPNLHYPVYHDPATGRLALEPFEGSQSLLPTFGDGTPAVWRWSREKLLRERERLVVRPVRRRRAGSTPDLFQKDYCHPGRTKKLRTLWLPEAIGTTDQAKAEAKRFNPTSVFATPKPERLLQRILELATRPGDLVLDPYLGSGTTAAVAHKLRRRWIGIEQGEQLETHCLPRLQRVIDGTDPGGVTAATGWTGGGGFGLCTLRVEE